MTVRQAVIRCADIGRVEAYLPGNYEVAYAYESPLHGPAVVIEGTDVAGWTLDGYVLPRLASGLIFGAEIIEEKR